MKLSSKKKKPYLFILKINIFAEKLIQAKFLFYNLLHNV